MSTPAEDEHRSIQSRLHDPGRHFPELGPLAGTMTKAIRNGSVSNITIGLVQLRAGQLAGSTYHTVRQTGLLRKAGESEKRIVALTSWRDAPYFTEAERVALDLVEAVLRATPSGERVSDRLFAEASVHYSEKALWTLILAISQICFFIPVAAIAKPIPGRPPGKNYS